MLKQISIILLAAILLSGCVSEERITTKMQEKKQKAAEKLRSFKTSLSSGDNLATFYKHEKTFYLPGNIEEVWELYCQVGPQNMWSGPKNKFKNAYSIPTKTGFYKKEKNIPGPSEGMVYELKLKVLKFLRVPVTFEITKLSDQTKIIEFTYGLENKSHGKQILEFSSVNGGTCVKHTSYFKSGNKFRDRRLYPFFHEKCIDEFHETMTKFLINFNSKS
ncbi:hypothetical protein [Parvicella tangerina]|uniref:Lipoprotein n=1 Tax=Parvicella tangerina TaxID=2829795 RepID=A0A916JLY7_9FLAO|nr:hypothetical protein [Parvicella tangerina]CAG5078530.1 hypothetical protein CRYO30217_00700 [Parvicella tangerina]